MPRSQRTEQQYAGTRDRILGAAREIIDSEGFSALSMRALAARVGLSAGAIYMYYAGKNDLIGALWQDASNDLGIHLEGISRNEPDPIAALRAVAIAYADFALRHPIPFRLLFSLNVERPPQPFDEDGRNHPAYDLVRRRMAEAIAMGVVQSQDVDLAVQILWAAIHGVLSLYVTCVNFPFCDPQALILHAIETVLNGLKANGPTSS